MAQSGVADRATRPDSHCRWLPRPTFDLWAEQPLCYVLMNFCGFAKAVAKS